MGDLPKYKMDLEDFKIKEIREFQENLKNLNIQQWKIEVKKFGELHGLTDREAIAVAKYELSEFKI